MFSEFAIFKRLAERSLVNDRSAKGLLIVMITLDGFSLAICRRFAEFTKLSHYTVYMERSILFSTKVYKCIA